MIKRMLFSFLMFIPAWMMLQAQDVSTASTQPKLEVYYFHATMRCPTCLAVEEQTRKTLDDSFADQLKSGTISLIVLNLEDKENKALVEKFEIGWSSLILYVPESGKTVNLTEDGFAYARTDPEKFRNLLQEKMKELM